jgi:DNA modification methylase
MLKFNQIYCIDNVKGMNLLDENSVDLTVTSPPYDDMRNYKGYSFDFENVAKGLYRITKNGGVIVWVVADGTLKGNETGTSFKQALYFKELGFNLLDTMIYHKRAVGACGSQFSYNQSFEYMFVFTKGKIKTFNPIKDLVPERAGKPTRYTKQSKSNKEGYSLETHIKIAPMGSKRQNMWTYDIGYGSGDDKTSHPAVFPESMTQDHILSWSNENDLVFDPFVGSGTTAKMAMLNNRNYIGFDSSQEYCNIAISRLEKYNKKQLLLGEK